MDSVVSGLSRPSFLAGGLEEQLEMGLGESDAEHLLELVGLDDRGGGERIDLVFLQGAGLDDLAGLLLDEVDRPALGRFPSDHHAAADQPGRIGQADDRGLAVDPQPPTVRTPPNRLMTITGTITCG